MKKNKGSAIIEMTLLIPVFLGCVFLYIMFFLFFIETGREMYYLSERIYAKEVEENNNFTDNSFKEIYVYTQGSTKIANINREDTWFSFHLELRKDESDPVINLRRWQMIANTVQ